MTQCLITIAAKKTQIVEQRIKKHVISAMHNNPKT
jgi:hypothetical protein